LIEKEKEQEKEEEEEKEEEISVEREGRHGKLKQWRTTLSRVYTVPMDTPVLSITK